MLQKTVCWYLVKRRRNVFPQKNKSKRKATSVKNRGFVVKYGSKIRLISLLNTVLKFDFDEKFEILKYEWSNFFTIF